MIALLMEHPGHHLDPDTLSVIPPIFCRILRSSSSALVLFFRRAVAVVRRKPAVPAHHPGAGAATPPDGLPVLGDKTIAEVRAETEAARRARQHADLMQAGYARAVDRLRRDAGLPTIEQMRQEYFRLPQRKPMINRPPWQTAELPVYQQACTADVLAAERLAEAVLP